LRSKIHSRNAIVSLDGCAQAVHHRLPVLDHRAHIPKRRVERLLQFRSGSFRNDVVKLYHHDAFQPRARQFFGWRLLRRALIEIDQAAIGCAAHMDDGVSEPFQRMAQIEDLAQRGIDQERHVVIDDLDERARRAMRARRLPGDADARGARLTPCKQGKRVSRGGCEGRWIGVAQIGFSYVGQHQPRQRPEIVRTLSLRGAFGHAIEGGEHVVECRGL